MATEYYMVGLKRPGGATIQEVEDYIESAVAGWKGGGHPDEPMFNLKPETVTAKKLTMSRAKRVLER